MMAADEDALTCDFAETYGVFDVQSLPAKTAATLAAGLPDAARIKRKIGGMSTSLETMLLAAILDGINMLVWSGTKDAQKGVNRPKSVLTAISSQQEKQEKTGYGTPEEFEAARAEILRRLQDGN